MVGLPLLDGSIRGPEPALDIRGALKEEQRTMPEPIITNDPTPPVTNPPAAAPPTVASSETKTFTQEQVNAMMADSKRDERNAAERALLETTGFATVEEAAQAKAERDAQEAANMTAAERAKKEADEDRAKAAAILAEAQAVKSNTGKAAALTAAGMTASLAETMASAIEVPLDATPEQTKAVVDAFKVQHPEIFGNPTGTVTGGIPSTTPKVQPIVSATGETPLATGAALAATLGYTKGE